MQRILGFGEGGPVDRARYLDRLQGEQDAPLRIHLEVRDGCGCQLARGRRPFVPRRPVALSRGEEGEPDRDERRHREDGDEGAETPERAAFELLLVRSSRLLLRQRAILPLARGIEVLTLLRRDRDA